MVGAICVLAPDTHLVSDAAPVAAPDLQSVIDGVQVFKKTTWRVEISRSASGANERIRRLYPVEWNQVFPPFEGSLACRYPPSGEGTALLQASAGEKKLALKTENRVPRRPSRQSPAPGIAMNASDSFAMPVPPSPGAESPAKSQKRE